MPTGYTAIIEDGEGCTFEEFVWRCARNFGAAIMMRDDSLDTPITDEAISNGSDTYYRERLDDARRRLAELESMTVDQAEVLAESEYRSALASHERYVAKQKETARRYEVMLRRVNGWEPPTPKHAGLKAFMIEQIEMCIPRVRESDATEKESGAEWLQQAIAEARSDIERLTKNLAEEKELTANRLAWVHSLRASVPQPQPRGR